MNGHARLNLSQWGVREWSMTALAMVVMLLAVFVAGRGLASGAAGDVLQIRFGGDAERTRVVVDLETTARGEVVETGAAARVVVGLRGVQPGRSRSGQGSGLVRGWRVAGNAGNARVELTLSGAAEIERRFLLPPGDGVNHYRYVIDLKSTGRPAARRPESRPAAPARPATRGERPLIIIDAGHGGHDPGASGAHSRESAVTLAAALALKTELERTGRYRVRLTRETDVYVDLYQRVRIARNAGADLFISLHADAGADPATRGASVYTLSEQGAGRAVREFTRSDDWHRSLNLPGRDPSVDRILLDMTQRATQNRSAQFARTLLTEIEDADHPLLRRSHRDAGLAVLLAPDVPAVLLEMGFITNPEDERFLNDSGHRRQLMRAVAQGIDAYFAELSAPVMYAGTPETGGAR